ncbi:pyridoxal phosphate-dependent transferase [Sphaerosporella brunnea]|uniref:Pyridoxal phosphate-dependent transferase n=1 Tax=Sphaerosporella brunnea TaxID=1250544 RepID=A0A5J5EIN8_9PEZI|nr:pyridoxal phosphate-dependent transferase [Sphaerosporella brunnea]
MQLPISPQDVRYKMRLALVTPPRPSFPAMLDLLRGHPSTRLLPTTALYEAAGVALNSPALLPQDSYAGTRHPLAYGPDKGNFNVREEIGRWVGGRYGLAHAVSPERIYLTNGASAGLAMALTLFTSPGTGYTRAAFLVSPTYFLAGKVFEDAGFADRLHTVRDLEDGIDFEGLERRLLEVQDAAPEVSLEEGLRPLLRRGAPAAAKRIYRYVLYCVPTYSNPTGTTWDLETRKKLLELARRWDMLIISDDVYDFLGNDDQPRTPPKRLVTLDAETAEGEGNTLSNCSFSKLVGPGLRTGWIEAATSALVQQLGEGGADRSGGAPSHFASCLLYPLLLPISPSNPTRKIDLQIQLLTSTYTSRCRALIAAIHTFLPKGTTYSGGVGGFFAWICLPEELDAAEVVKLGREEGVIVAAGALSEVPGEGNALGWGKRYVRVAVSWAEEEELVEGMKRLGIACERWLAGGRAKDGEV